MHRPSQFTHHVSRFTRLLLGAALLLLISGRFPTAAQAPNHAALIVDFGGGRVAVRVVSFAGETISGVDLLQQSGLDVAVMVNLGGGAALCAVEGVGCAPTPQDCFCQCRGTPCRYWSYFHLQDGAWVYAGMGAANHILRDGDVDGWAWGDGTTAPPLLTWEEIWAQGGAAPPPTPPLPTATPPPPTTNAPPPTTPPELAATPAPETLAAPAVPTTALPEPTPPPAAPSALPPAGPTVTPTLAGEPAPTATGPETSPPAVSPPETTAAETPWGQLAAFGGLVLLLAALALWLRRRR